MDFLDDRHERLSAVRGLEEAGVAAFPQLRGLEIDPAARVSQPAPLAIRVPVVQAIRAVLFCHLIIAVS